MRNILLTTLIATLVTGCNMNETKISPPIAEKIPQELTENEHGNTRIDNYFWMRLTDEQKVAEQKDERTLKVIEYLEKENEYTQTVLGHTKELQEKLYEEIVGRIKQKDESVPYKENGYFYYRRYEEGKEYPIHCRKKDNLDNTEEIILDVNKLAEGKDYCKVRAISISPDNKLMAFGLDTVSRRQYDIYIKNLETGELLEDNIKNTLGSVVWANDNKTFFYVTKDETLRPNKIFKHKLGHSQEKDNLIYEEKDPTYISYVIKSKSNRFIEIVSLSTLSTEYRFLDANTPDAEFKVFEPRERGVEYSIYHFEDHFYIKTNLNAKNFQIMKTPVAKTGKENWKTVIEHREDVYLNDVDIFKEYLVLSERKNGLIEIRVIKWDDNSEFYIDFGEETYSVYTTTNLDFDTEILRYFYNSLTTPASTYEINLASKEKALLKQTEVLGGYNPDEYMAERHYATGRDGTKIPISLVYKKGLIRDGENPLLLYAYGSYGSSTDPNFNSHRLSLLDRGFVFAIAHVRGGQELGRQWYEDGKLLKKKNTFYDFIDCGIYLIEEDFTNSDMIFAYGGSAGGLLVGTVINMAPDLFKGAIAAVPFVDVISTMLDESIPLTTGEFDEWGNPKEKEYYDYMLSYSPYDNIEAKDYPALLVTTGFHDSQVQYWEPAKWVAKLRDMKTDDNLLMLHTNMSFGHGGASGRFERYKEIALVYAFMLDQIEN